MRDFRYSDLLGFEKMLSITLVKLLYILGLVGIGLVVIVSAFGSLAAMRFSFAAGFGGLLLAVVGGGIGALVWRVVCELWMVVFGIYDRLGQWRAANEKDASSLHGPDFRRSKKMVGYNM